MRYGIFLFGVRSRMSLRLLVCVHAQPQRLAGPEERGKFLVHRDGFTISWIAAQPRGAAPGGEGTKAAQFHPIAAGKRRGDFVEDCRDDGCNVLMPQGRVRGGNLRDEFGSGQCHSAIGFGCDARGGQRGQHADLKADPTPTACAWWHTSLLGPISPCEGEARLKGQPMVFKIGKKQLAERDTLAADLRKKAEALNIATVAFNQAIGPLSQAVGDALEDYNGILEKARPLADIITEAAQAEFDTKFEKWQESDAGIQVRRWIEQWERSLDDVDLDLPEPLTEIDPDEHAGAIEGASPVPTD